MKGKEKDYLGALREEERTKHGKTADPASPLFDPNTERGKRGASLGASPPAKGGKKGETTDALKKMRKRLPKVGGIYSLPLGKRGKTKEAGGDCRLDEKRKPEPGEKSFYV